MTSSTSKQVYFGSARWLDADFTQRTSKLRRDTNWEYLIKICCELRQLQCHLVDKISIGHLSMERRILFEDGKSWLVRLRMPDLEGFPTDQGVKMALSAEVACLKFLRFVVLYFSSAIRILFQGNSNTITGMNSHTSLKRTVVQSGS